MTWAVRMYAIPLMSKGEFCELWGLSLIQMTLVNIDLHHN